MVVVLFLVYAGMFPYWVFGFSFLLARVLHRKNPTSLAKRSFVVGNLATLTSLSYKVNTTASLCVVCGGGEPVRGWPFVWQGLEALDATAAPFALIGSIGVWWGIAALVLRGASLIQQRSGHPQVQRSIQPLATALLILGPFLFLFLDIST